MITFVILHYKNINDTIDCLKSIKSIDNQKKISIVVVDNNSLLDNDKNKILKYTTDLILLSENLGFAKGNNKGCDYAINKYHPDYLCVINNDIIINQKDFVERIEKIYNKTSFDILGPKIITNFGDSVNPFYAYETIEEIDKKINYSNKIIKIYENILYRNLLKVYIFVKRLVKKTKKLENGSEPKFDVALHGCALIFSKKYYKKYKYVFYNETFLYHEEEFLNYRRHMDNLITYYDNTLEVFHKEGSSLNEVFSDNYQKIIFRHKEIIKSLTLLKNVIKNNKKI